MALPPGTHIGSYEIVAQIEQAGIHFALSPSGDSLAMGLADGVTTNIWTLGTSDGAWRQITDLGSEEPTVIARQVSWAPDGRHLYAAVSRSNGNVVMIDGLL